MPALMRRVRGARLGRVQTENVPSALFRHGERRECTGGAFTSDGEARCGSWLKVLPNAGTSHSITGAFQSNKGTSQSNTGTSQSYTRAFSSSTSASPSTTGALHHQAWHLGRRCSATWRRFLSGSRCSLRFDGWFTWTVHCTASYISKAIWPPRNLHARPRSHLGAMPVWIPMFFTIRRVVYVDGTYTAYYDTTSAYLLHTLPGCPYGSRCSLRSDAWCT